jgi:urea transport system substrate-binding protein
VAFPSRRAAAGGPGAVASWRTTASSGLAAPAAGTLTAAPGPRPKEAPVSTLSRREFVKSTLVAGAGVAAGLGVPRLLPAQGKAPIKVGVLHSLSGTMAISEVSLRDTVLMAIEEINAKGGVVGRKVEAVVVDPASNWDLFAEKAKQLLLQDKVAVVFGCWTSVSRKSVLPVFEGNNGLLFYPVQYEGEECSKNVFYTGATPNQQLIPGAEYLMSKEGGGYRKFYLLGTDYVFPRTANKILRAFLLAKGVPAADIAEEYTPFNHQDYQTIVGKIKRFTAGGGAAVLSTINGDSNVPFYKEFGNQGLRAEDAPIMAFSVAEDELRGMDTGALVGHLAAWNYYQSVDVPQNKKFVQAFKAYCKKANLPGGDKRVTDDPIEAAYFGVYIWKQAVEKAQSTEVDAVRKAVYGQEFLAPGGKIKMHEANHHTYKPVLIGEILKDGQFKVVSRTKGLVEPEPWSKYTSPDKGCDWINHQGTYQKKA